MENVATKSIELEFRIDWLSFTIHGPKDTADYVWQEYLQEHLGALEDKGHGARSYKRLRIGEKGSKVYTLPTSGEEHYHIELPGQACACIPHEALSMLFSWLKTIEEGSNQEFRFMVKRMDMAFDGVPFTPEHFEKAISENRVRSLTQRRSLSIVKAPFMPKEDDSGYGQSTTYFGSPKSTRRVRVYDMRGPTRFEFVAKDVRADGIARYMLVEEPSLWPKIAISHIRDFMDIYQTEQRHELENWWVEFIQEASRAYMTVHNSKELTEIGIKSWMEEQISKWLYVIDSKDPEFIERIKREGAKNLKPHHRRILNGGNDGRKN